MNKNDKKESQSLVYTDWPRCRKNMFLLTYFFFQHASFSATSRWLLINYDAFVIFKEYHSFNKYQGSYHTKSFPNYSLQNQAKYFHIYWHPQNQHSLHMCEYYFSDCFKYSTQAYLWGEEGPLFLSTHISDTKCHGFVFPLFFKLD